MGKKEQGIIQNPQQPTVLFDAFKKLKMRKIYKKKFKKLILHFSFKDKDSEQLSSFVINIFMLIHFSTY